LPAAQGILPGTGREPPSRAPSSDLGLPVAGHVVGSADRCGGARSPARHLVSLCLLA